MALQTSQPSEKRRVPMSSEESEIRDVLERFSEALTAKDLDKIMSFYSEDVVAFDVMPPLQMVGKEEYRKAWNHYVTGMQGSSTYKIRDLHVIAGNDVGYSHCLSHMTGTTNDGQKIDCWMRQTNCFKRINGQWLITHEQYSVPIDPKTDKALWNLTPESTSASH
ncbi:nuclear transport factor 2 family protein [Bdellovibrio sp. 22V]|uniref:YybH family protein n=1 Tax=Bdellovibrio TaxID=958 RepID=UPI002543AB43|nr:nuclear transport factor 2 family protein [Bdellovibrio sp. 22V]WII73498.1 nuclear transport factor 2 family protein [Bdellovibrio sp. 22V]